MRILVLFGPNSCGKTTTLNLVYDMLLQRGGVSTNRQHLGGNKKDFSDVVLWNGQTVAFFTMGDFAKPLIQAIRMYAAQNCDVLVCACNDRHVTPPQEINLYQNTPFRKQQQPNKQLRSAIDNQFAQNIFNAI